MLDGINVLSQIELTSISERWNIVMYIAICLFISSVLFSIIGLEYSDLLTEISLVLIIISLFTLVFIVSNPNTKVGTGKFEYKCTIDDNVLMNEFNSMYNIIDVEGEIYTIQEK